MVIALDVNNKFVDTEYIYGKVVYATIDLGVALATFSIIRSSDPERGRCFSL